MTKQILLFISELDMVGKGWNDERKRKYSERMAGTGNHRYGKKPSLQTRIKIGLSHIGKMMGEENPSWRGDAVECPGLHDWVKTRLPKPERCENCSRKATLLDLACVTGVYTRDLDNWKYLCRKCHSDLDKSYMKVPRDPETGRFVKKQNRLPKKEYLANLMRGDGE